MAEDQDSGMANIKADPWAAPPVDWEKWGKHQTARLWQAAALYCDISPDWLESQAAPGRMDTLFRRIPGHVTELIDLAKAAIGGQKLRVNMRDNNALEDCEIDLTAFTAWAYAIGKKEPQGFPWGAQSKGARSEPAPDTPIGERERTTLLILIAALAKEARIDLSKPTKAAGLIEDLTQQLGTRVAARMLNCTEI